MDELEFISFLTEEQEILLEDKSIEDFLSFVTENLKTYGYTVLKENERFYKSLFFSSKKSSDTLLLEMKIDIDSKTFAFYFNKETGFDSLSEASEPIKKEVGFLALDLMATVAKWEEKLIIEAYNEKMFEINISPQNALSQDIAKLILQHENIRFTQESFSGRIVIYADRTFDKEPEPEEDSSDEWI